MDIKEFVTAIAEISDVVVEDGHPLLTRIKFIFATDEGANLSTSLPGLKQGIKAEDFDQIIETAINAPIKMRYLGRRLGAQKHFGSIPIGHITKMEKTVLENGVAALAAEGVLYTNEYTEEVEYLKEAFASNEAPGISYEVRHNPKKSIVEQGVEWIKDLITQAATIVKDPAYGSRTAILALASNKSLTNDEFKEEVLGLMTPTEATNKGGSGMDEKDKEIARLTALAEEKDKVLNEKEKALADKETSFASLNTELETLRTELATAKAENDTLKKTMLIESRAKAYTDAGLAFEEDTEKATAKKELLARMDEEVFTAYISDIKAKPANALAAASARSGAPRLNVDRHDTSLDDLKESLRGISRA